ncbi:MAG: hypothetical protein IJ635_00745 [Bacteroidaceae bacterium]|nr:hypothetical protein [Bacteroidaceae bacterium]
MRREKKRKNQETKNPHGCAAYCPMWVAASAQWGWRLLPDRDGGSCPIRVGDCSPMAVASQARQVGRLLPDVAKILSGRGQQE